MITGRREIWFDSDSGTRHRLDGFCTAPGGSGTLVFGGKVADCETGMLRVREDGVDYPLGPVRLRPEGKAASRHYYAVLAVGTGKPAALDAIRALLGSPGDGASAHFDSAD